MLFKGLFRWLYHTRQRRAAKRRLSGKGRATPKWHRFSYNVFRKASFGKYELREIRTKWISWAIGIPVGLFAIWFIWQSVEAVGMFQP